jgi:multidrug efflux pump subunit AcrA (membrane-fusion protein)
MTKIVKVLVIALIMAGAIATAWSIYDSGRFEEATGNREVAVVTRGEFTVYSTHDGIVESRRMTTISSRYQGAATLVELAEEGRRVKAGDVLARFDASEIETRMMKLEQELAIARSELDALKNAELPLQRTTLELALEDANRKLEAERSYLEDSIDLRRDNMVSEQEVLLQRRKVRNLEAEAEKARLELELTSDFLHPAALSKAKTAVFTAEQSLNVAREQLRNSQILAPAAGVVVYKPLSLGSEFRRVRIGDTLYPNQPFMVLPDMSDLVVALDVPEAELQSVPPGASCLVLPVSYPDLRLTGSVESIGAIAQSIPGKPAWQKYFHVTIGIPGSDPRVRPGMSVVARIVSYRNDNALLVPRRAVSWSGDRARVRVFSDGGFEDRSVVPGKANLGEYEILDGLAVGDRVELR